MLLPHMHYRPLVSEIKESGTAQICQIRGESAAPCTPSEWVAEPWGITSFICLTPGAGQSEARVRGSVWAMRIPSQTLI